MTKAIPTRELDITLISLVEKVQITPVKNRPQLKAKIKASVFIPARTDEDGNQHDGYLRYFTIWAYGALAVKVQEADLRRADWIRVVARDFKASAWTPKPGADPIAFLEVTAETIDFRVPRPQGA